MLEARGVTADTNDFPRVGMKKATASNFPISGCLGSVELLSIPSTLKR